jgi:hypothetical protein
MWGNGGSVISGGDGASETLYLRGTTHATDGTVYIQDQGGNTYIGDHTVGQGIFVGEAYMGTWITAGTYANFSHEDMSQSGTGYALVQSNGGSTILNCETGSSMILRVGNATRTTWTGNTMTMNDCSIVMANQDITGVDDITGNNGSIFSGGTGSGANLNLQSTTHATKGNIYFGTDAASYYNDNTNNLFIDNDVLADTFLGKAGTFVTTIGDATRAATVATLTTTERNALTAVNGMIIYNSTTTQFEFYENGSWVSGSGLA